LIETTVENLLNNKSSLIEKFYGLLAAAGYSKIFAEEYRKLKFDIIESIVFNVDENFPKFTSQNLVHPLSTRISNIVYKIDLQGLNGLKFNDIQIGSYFY